MKVILRADAADLPRVIETDSPLSRWRTVVASSADPCLTLDAEGVVVAMSASARAYLGCEEEDPVDRHLLEAVTLVDLDTAALDPPYSFRVGPLAVLGAPGLSRSLTRIRHPTGPLVTLDVVSAPLHDVNGDLIGSLTFLAPIAMA